MNLLRWNYGLSKLPNLQQFSRIKGIDKTYKIKKLHTSMVLIMHTPILK